jgi:hypothetical protein
MSKPTPSVWPTDHPEIVAIALDIMLVPARREHYSELVLMLADAALERIKRELTAQSAGESIRAVSPFLHDTP